MDKSQFHHAIRGGSNSNPVAFEQIPRKELWTQIASKIWNIVCHLEIASMMDLRYGWKRHSLKKIFEKTHLRYRLAMRQERKNLEATGGVMDPTTRLE